MNEIEVFQHSNGTYDFRIKDAGNHKILCFSDQGYENSSDAIDAATSVTTDPTLPDITFTGRVQ